MMVINAPVKQINQIVIGKEDGVYVSHKDGLKRFDTKAHTWIDIIAHNTVGATQKLKGITKSTQQDVYGGMFIISGAGLVIYQKGIIKKLPYPYFEEPRHEGYQIATSPRAIWVVSVSDNKLFKYQNGVVSPFNNDTLNQALSNRKVTNIKYLANGFMWITTY